MANKALWEVLDNTKTNIEDVYEFCDEVLAEFGDGYDVEIWDWDDYEPSELVNSVAQWIADQSKGREVVDLQSKEKWNADETACFTVVVIKTKEI